MLALMMQASLGAPSSDLITSLPGFGDASSWPFNAYSGYLTVPGPFKLNPYDSLSIHYQFHTSQKNATADPVVTWHQGGPGGSSITVGLYTEMGYFQIDDEGFHVNDYAWNKVANMLYLESPAGSGQSSGFSSCIKGGKAVACSWDDVSQAEAYAHSLLAFYKAFPEFSSNELYLTGESYFGQYGPNIAAYILQNPANFSPINLKGAALGNACWGGDLSHVNCNGPNSEQNDIDMFFGKGLIPKKLYQDIYATCDFPHISAACDIKLEEASTAVGPHNVYNIYDDCAGAALEKGVSMRKVTKYLRENMVGALEEGELPQAARDRRHLSTGGYTWSCGGMDATEQYMRRDDVQAALHLGKADLSSFHYKTSGPASITLYPYLIGKLRLLIYNGDADACVPYKGNEEWITSLETAGNLTQSKKWAPWYASSTRRTAPAGYVTSYAVAGAPAVDFSFLTIRLAGHMVPTFQPKPSLVFFERFLARQPF